jgi:hypothetical protein
MDGTASGLCPVAHFGIIIVEPLVSSTKVLMIKKYGYVIFVCCR